MNFLRLRNLDILSLYIHLKKNTFDSVRSGKMDNIVAQKYTLETSRHQFLYCGSKTWNNMNEKTIKLGINVLSDFSISSFILKF